MKRRYMARLLVFVLIFSIITTRIIAVDTDTDVTDIPVVQPSVSIDEIKSVDSIDEVTDTDSEESTDEVDTEEFTEEETEIEIESTVSEESYDINYSDSELLAKIAMAEAGNQGVEGKAFVMLVVLNRVADSRFPDTVEGVITQSGQFSPVSAGIFYGVEPDDECYEALDLIMAQNWDESQGALYFESRASADNWHSRNLEYLFTHGGHRFYK